MNEKALRTLEFYKIREKLVGFAGSQLGKRRCAALVPTNHMEEIVRMQTETTDALKRIYKQGSVSFTGIPEIRDSVIRLGVGAVLGAGELIKISNVLTVTLRVKNYGYSSKDPAKEIEGDSLSERFSLLEPLSPVNNEILRCIISEEDIADDASTGLKSVRRQMKLTHDRIREQLGSILNSSTTRGMLQDALITMRNGRFCIPVKQEFKNQIPGMVHDQSATGSTAFIEPMAIVKLNNELSELSIREHEEIEKVLAELSNMVAGEIEHLKYNLEVLEELDFIFAKALLSKQMKATEPIFNDRHYISIKKGRHPLIDAHKVVPIDIYLGGDFHLLVITGPNTGGKTVSLKTVGLFTLLGQAGLHIPAFDGSELGVFDEVYADIGDEQSIEQSLSTFSSHMTNTVSILREANENSLALFDELGAGTDPTEGAALATSILSYLKERGIRTMATTHYSELKIYALTNEGVCNASCEFSVETLRPTYRLLIGIPGKSNAFAISAKLGLPEHIIEHARELIGTKDESFEDVIQTLEAKRIEMEKAQEEILSHKKEVEQLKQRLEEKNKRIDHAKDKILREANEKARDLLSEAKIHADETIRKFNKWSMDGNFSKEMEQERNALRKKLGDTDSELGIKKKKNSKEHKPGDFRIGDSVMVLSLNLKGTVSTLPNAKGDLYVQMGILRSSVNISDLELLNEEEVILPDGHKTQSGKIRMSKGLTIHPELNLIGKRVDEALPLLDKYLDDAYLAHLPQVTIIHGRGTGALRDAVHAYLKKTKYVKSFRMGAFGEGDHGVTIVEFK